MQNEALSDSAYGNVHGGAGTKSQNDQDGDVFASLYSSLVMAPETTTNTTLSHSPHNPFADPSTLHDSRFYSRLLIRQQEQQHQQRQRQQQQQQHQDMINRHNLCLTRLREAAREAESLRHENASLRSVNLELNKHISLLIKSSVNEQFSSTNGDGTSSFGLANAMRGLSVGGVGGGGEEACVESPTSVMENVEVKRISLPKSISVRSNGYLKMGQGQGQGQAAASSAAPAAANKPRPRTAMPLKPTQKVYVKGGKQEEEPLELEVYNQGMFKTELCNKWQETGACPYGDQCQFAHGIEELRPVIRHPRYKTEVCRMVLAGDICPYGHRCHFRHALTEQERFMGHLNPRSIKLN